MKPANVAVASTSATSGSRACMRLSGGRHRRKPQTKEDSRGSHSRRVHKCGSLPCPSWWSQSSFVALTNAPASNRVVISFATWSDDGPVFRLTNREPHAILLWNVRVQTRSTDGGTDGFGWDTVYDDYPMG